MQSKNYFLHQENETTRGWNDFMIFDEQLLSYWIS